MSWVPSLPCHTDPWAESTEPARSSLSAAAAVPSPPQVGRGQVGWQSKLSYFPNLTRGAGSALGLTANGGQTGKCLSGRHSKCFYEDTEVPGTPAIYCWPDL